MVSNQPSVISAGPIVRSPALIIDQVDLKRRLRALLPAASRRRSQAAFLVVFLRTAGWRVAGFFFVDALLEGAAVRFAFTVWLAGFVETGATEQIFTNPKDKRTQDYITGRFG